MKDKADELEKQSAANDFWDDPNAAQKVMKRIKQLSSIVEPWDEMLSDIEENLEMARLLDAEDADDASPEVKELENLTETLEKRFDKLELRSMLSREHDMSNCFLHIHAGAGGTESCDWAQMLMRMYVRWAEIRGFKVKEEDLQPGDEAGIKSTTLFIQGDYAYGYLKAESGVHRLVRISPFDANSRRHTSFASVHASPEVDEDVDIEINENDIRVDRYCSSGPGGQGVNTTYSAVRITHIPTRIVVTCQNERSQHKNLATAMKVLRSRLYQLHLEEKEKELAAIEPGKKDIAWGSQIRSYVFHPYNMVKDHRTDHETGNVQAMMNGQILDDFIEAYLKEQMKTSKK